MKGSKAFALGWDTCSASLFTPCKPNLELSRKAGVVMGSPAYLDEVQADSEQDSNSKVKYDYFLDLGDTTAEKEQVGRMVLPGQRKGRTMSSSKKVDNKDTEVEESPSFVDMYASKPQKGKCVGNTN